MNDNWLIILVLLGLTIFFVAFFMSAAKLDQEAEQTWQELAAHTGLTYKRAFGQITPSLVGIYRNRTLICDTVDTGGELYSESYSRIVLSINNHANIYLKLSKKDKFSKFGEFPSSQRIKIGDEEFDRQFAMTSQPAEFTFNLFASTDLRQKLLQTPYWLEVRVDGQEIYFEGGRGGSIMKVKDLLPVFDLLSDLAEAIEKVS